MQLTNSMLGIASSNAAQTAPRSPIMLRILHKLH